jgi:hypothetical protein
MDRGPDDDRDRFDDERGDAPAPPLDAILRGGGAALALDLLFSVGMQLARPAIKHAGLAAATAYAVLASKLFSGYVGGRIASRRGVAHDDVGSRRTMALGVTAFTMAAMVIVDRALPWARLVQQVGPQWPGPPPGVRLVAFVFEVILLSWMVSFGLEMGIWAQARRDDKVQDEEPSADD